ncbi:hypothetical protein Prede_1263 [Prevotella dentalis DSM 3688]|uniref:Uncharacterized protein n=1 Tax=Prevotella dentalis (strain ATCC 49559 / DSM 3688 / JCM 13448 / NCTC 12043 / ES 2772) TaxID=908937 RepID=L0JAL3_PREDD|nr:hypothetical protein Prede_1263 [Prevotella dentalis DSM 3688]
MINFNPGRAVNVELNRMGWGLRNAAAGAQWGSVGCTTELRRRCGCGVGALRLRRNGVAFAVKSRGVCAVIAMRLRRDGRA